MAHSNYHIYYSDQTVESYQNTNYKIRLLKQIYNTTNERNTKSLVTGYIDSVKKQLDYIISACSNAKAKCGTDSLSLIRDGSTETNEFPAQLDKLSNDADALKTKLETMKTTINDIAGNATSRDNNEYQRWQNAPENPKNQQTSQPTNASNPQH